MRERETLRNDRMLYRGLLGKLIATNPLLQTVEVWATGTAT